MDVNFSVDYNHLDFQDRDDVEPGEKHFYLAISIGNDQFKFTLDRILTYREYCDRQLFEDFAQGKNVEFFKQRMDNTYFQDISINCRNGRVVIRKHDNTSSGRILFEIKHELIAPQINAALLHLIAHGFFD